MLFRSKAGVSYKRFVREFRLEDAESYEVAQEIKADIFAAGEKVDATAISKGKGFQGAIKRHGQSRGPMAHGSKYHRHAGSNGACSDPSRVFKGKKMAGLAIKKVASFSHFTSTTSGDCTLSRVCLSDFHAVFHTSGGRI